MPVQVVTQLNMAYDVIGEDLGITQSQLKEYLMFNAQQTFDTINASMTSEDASG